jgi:hypothetical protein
VTLATFAIDVTSIILRRRMFIAGWRVSASSNSLEADEFLATARATLNLVRHR